MRKLLAFCALALMAGYVQAQVTAGKMMIGGNVGYSTQTSESVYGESKHKTFNANQQFGYFVVDNLAVGLETNFSQIKSNFDYLDAIDTDAKNTNTTIAPFVRYYMFTSNAKFAFNAEAAVGFGVAKFRGTNDDEFKTNIFTARLSPDFSYFLSDKWALDLQLSGISYSSSDQRTDADAGNGKTSSFMFGVSSLNPYLGFRHFIGK